MKHEKKASMKKEVEKMSGKKDMKHKDSKMADSEKMARVKKKK